jgi:uncharacterized protein YigE (DUF2233 family)
MKNLLLFLSIFNFSLSYSQYVSTTVDPKKSDIQLFWQKENSINRVRNSVEDQGKELVVAMNAGMYYEDYSPMGLYVQKGKIIKNLNLKKGKTNFYTSPGVFYLKDRKAYICRSIDYPGGAYLATQSGPILLTDGKINPIFSKTGNKNIRNGIGILPDGRVVFAISKGLVSFYDFASYFKDQGCTSALFMDGCISAMYLNGEMTQGDGYFGVIIGVIK